MTPFLADEALVNLILVHFMVSIRFMAMILTASVFMLPSMPIPVKFWLSVMLAIVVTPVAEVEVPGVLLGSWVYLFIMVGREFLIGTSIGVISSLPIYAMQVSGYFDSTLMGFNMMNIFDPLSVSQTSVLAQMKYLLAIWFYLHWNGHMLLIQALSESIKLVPIGIGVWDGAGEIPWLEWLGTIFVIALKMSLPIFGSLLLAEVGLGFVARTVPQMNVFVLGIPLKIAMGFFVLLMVFPSSVDIFHKEIERAVEWAVRGIHFWR